MINAGVGRRVEWWLCKKLGAAIPSLRFFASERDDTVDDDEMYVVCRAEEVEETTAGAYVYYVDVAVVLVSHVDDAASDEHDEALRAIEEQINALNAVMPQNDAALEVTAYGWGPATNRPASQFETFGDVMMFRGGFGTFRVKAS